MATVVAEMTMSLDGFVADPSDGVDELFGWYANGDVAVPSADPDRTFHVSEASAGHLRDLLNNLGGLPRPPALIGPQDPVRPRRPRQGSGGTLGIEVLHG
jgi:hypothetical protein